MTGVIDHNALARCLQRIGLDDWHATIKPIVDARLSDRQHGDFTSWQQTLQALPDAREDSVALTKLLRQLAPWRKGPFELSGVNIDAEWRSNLKWARIENVIEALDDRAVLDVGSGNGYYAVQMRRAGATTVIGIDPTLLYVMQFLAVNIFEQVSDVFVLPLRLHEIPLPAKKFDTAFSMGVLYHQRAPIDHLRQLRQTLKSGGQLVLETIYLPGEQAQSSTPEDRYARMRNVWHLPTVPELLTWLKRTGYEDLAIIDRSVTSVDEQRSTTWMTFESLLEALDPDNSSLTIEGWPAPRRVVVTAISP